jgi:hemolysin-activating ACP:hemolysin acyltransferase
METATEQVNGGRRRTTLAERNALTANSQRAIAFGEIMSVLMQSQRHRNVTLGALLRQMAPAFLTDQFVLARARAKRDDAETAPVGVAFWASVSEAVDDRLSADPAQPIELADDEWLSGPIVWLIDVVAAPRVSQAMLRSIRERVGTDATIKVRTTGRDGNSLITTIK